MFKELKVQLGIWKKNMYITFNNAKRFTFKHKVERNIIWRSRIFGLSERNGLILNQFAPARTFIYGPFNRALGIYRMFSIRQTKTIERAGVQLTSLENRAGEIPMLYNIFLDLVYKNITLMTHDTLYHPKALIFSQDCPYYCRCRTDRIYYCYSSRHATDPLPLRRVAQAGEWVLVPKLLSMILWSSASKSSLHARSASPNSQGWWQTRPLARLLLLVYWLGVNSSTKHILQGKNEF